jgi:hypothetical protein
MQWAAIGDSAERFLAFVDAIAPSPRMPFPADEKNVP